MTQRSSIREALGQRAPVILGIIGLGTLSQIRTMLYLRRPGLIGLRSAPAHDRRHDHIEKEGPDIFIFIVVVERRVMLSVSRHKAKLQRVRLGSGGIRVKEGIVCGTAVDGKVSR